MAAATIAQKGKIPFKKRVDESSKVAHVFWVVANADTDKTRLLDPYETKNVAEKAVAAGLMEEVSNTGRKYDPGFRLTKAGVQYYEKAIAKNLPKGFASDKPLITSTYYHRFPSEPRKNSNLVHVFWVVKHDYRVLNERERRNVVYPAVAAGLMEKAPLDEDMIARRKTGAVSKCRFMLTEDGTRYYREIISPILPEGFVSKTTPIKIHRGAAHDEVSTKEE